MKTKSIVPAVLAAAIACASLSAGATSSYGDSATVGKDIAVNSSAEGRSGYANELHAQAKMEMTAATPVAARAQNVDRTAKARILPAQLFQLRESAGG